MSRYFDVKRNVDLNTPEGRRTVESVIVELRRVCDACSLEVSVLPPWSPDFDPMPLMKWGLLEGSNTNYPLFDFCPSCVDRVADILRAAGVRDFFTNANDMAAAIITEKKGARA